MSALKETYNPNEIEKKSREYWETHNTFVVDEKSTKEKFNFKQKILQHKKTSHEVEVFLTFLQKTHLPCHHPLLYCYHDSRQRQDNFLR